MRERKIEMEIDDLLNKYFEGETSCKEEQWIRDYFSKEEVPAHLLCYKPMFAYFKNEISIEQNKKKIISGRKKFIYTLSSIAACAVIAVGISTFMHSSNDSCTGNYVVINGKYYNKGLC